MIKEITNYARQFKTDYNSKYLRIDGKDVFNMKDTIDLVRLYINNTSRDGDMEFVFNTTQQILNNAKKAEDIDTKDMIIVSDSPNYYWQSLLLRGQNRKWMKMVNWGTTLNRMTEQRNTFGGVLVKKSSKKVKGRKVVDVEVMQWADAYFDINDIQLGTKMFLMSLPNHEVREMLTDDQKGKWDKAEDENKKCYYLYGYLSKDYIDSTLSSDYVYQWHKLVEIDGEMYCVDSELMDKDIFRYKEYQPRYGFANPHNILGRGAVETAFVPQQITNLMMNKQTDILKVAGNVLASTEMGAQADSMQGSTMFELQNGSQLPPGIRPVDLMPGSSFNGMTSLTQTVQQQMKDNTSSQDIVSGQMPPSGTTLGATQIVNSEARGFYDYMREGMALFINELYQDWILPDLAKQLKGKDSVILEFSAEELLKIDQKLIDQQSGKMLVEAFDKGKAPKSIEELQFLQQAASQVVRADAEEKGNMREMVVKELDMEDAEYRVQVMITNEQRNTQAYVQAANQIAMNMLQAQGNPIAMKMLKKSADAIGVNETELMS